MKKNIKIAGSIVLLILVVRYFNPFSSTQIMVLDHLTYYNRDSIIVQICLVKNQPSKSEKLKELIQEFEQNNLTKKRDYKRLFIKQHNHILLPALTFSENIDYSDNTTTRNDLDNIDFLATSSSLLDADGKRINNLSINIGKIWYYKK